MSTLDELRECSASWEPDVRLVGNVRAGDIVTLCDSISTLIDAARLVCGSHDNGECRQVLNEELALRIDVIDGDPDALAELALREAAK